MTAPTPRGDRAHPTNRGRLCTKGAISAELRTAPDRLTTALVHAERDAAPTPTGVDAALTTTARRARDPGRARPGRAGLDAGRMAKDVDRALREIVVAHGGRTEDEADAYVRQMVGERRYVRDVY
ncbi:hypothetical protein [Embleya sp. NPDC020630]|uniref:hypothetical protein n=1 Tax=Embleya sp. NPDC020630 TaxID=3363979 RepID=UPI003799D72B